VGERALNAPFMAASKLPEPWQTRVWSGWQGATNRFLPNFRSSQTIEGSPDYYWDNHMEGHVAPIPNYYSSGSWY